MLESKSRDELLNTNGLSDSSHRNTLSVYVPDIQRETVVRSNETIEKEFDAYAQQYESALNEGLGVSGEGPEYFAEKRIHWTAQVLKECSSINSVLDFGCGVGIATPLISKSFSPEKICGFDPSTEAIRRAKIEFAGDGINFTATSKAIPTEQFDLAYCNGVFHHILPANRDLAFETVFRSLKAGGWFAFWENNPWNPGTRYVMSKIPFDRDAVVISPIQARALLKQAGFRIVRSDAWFLFPRSLSWLRPLEKCVHRLPLGAQYLVLAQKP
jgi:SAM-dependent methyltransferase